VDDMQPCGAKLCGQQIRYKKRPIAKVMGR
jgi:hypothetical protein